VSNGSGTITLAGGATQALVGWESAALVGRPLHETLHPGPAEDCPVCEARPGSAVFRTADGGEVTLPATRVYLEGDAGATLTVLGSAAGENQALRRDFEAFAYAVSHDLLEPLRTVSGFVTLLEKRYRGKLDRDADEFIEFAVSGARRMQALLDALLAFSRVATRGKPPAPVPARDALDEGLEPLRKDLDAAGAVLDVGDLPTVRADTPQLAELFRILVDNALKFRGDAPPKIAIRARRTGAFWTFTVDDEGIGIPAGSAEEVFRIFRQLHPRGRYEGVGAGLAIARRIVERHGGAIRVEPRERGTRIVFTWPS